MSATVVINTIYFPRRDGEAGAPEPVPYVLTDKDMIRLTRLDETDNEKPERTLARYRQKGWLRSVQVGPEVRYTLPDALDFLDRLKEENPR